MTYLITGGAGFIGSHLVDDLIRDSDASRIFVLDDLSSGKEENLPKDPRVELIRQDVCDKPSLDRLFSRQDFNYIVHLAADASVQNSIRDTAAAHRLNFDATLSLLESAKGLKSLKRFLYSSSAAVYGDKPSLPCRETDAVNPISPYGIDKYASERYTLGYHRLFGVPTAAFRFFNVYGPRQNASSPYTGVISIFFNRLLDGNKTLTVFGDGRQTRDFVHVSDVIRALRIGLASPKVPGNVFNTGTGKKTSLLQVIAVMEKIFKVKITIDLRPARIGDIRHSVSSIGRLADLGYKPGYDLQKGLEDYRASLRPAV